MSTKVEDPNQLPVIKANSLRRGQLGRVITENGKKGAIVTRAASCIVILHDTNHVTPFDCWSDPTAGDFDVEILPAGSRVVITQD